MCKQKPIVQSVERDIRYKKMFKGFHLNCHILDKTLLLSNLSLQNGQKKTMKIAKTVHDCLLAYMYISNQSAKTSIKSFIQKTDFKKVFLSMTREWWFASTIH